MYDHGSYPVRGPTINREAMACMMRYFIALCFLALPAPNSLLHAKSHKCDVLVYGATPAGVCAAVAASREGASVILVSPDGFVVVDALQLLESSKR